VQAQGAWAGRRQLFVRFAAEAETATMYTAHALAKELERVCARSVVHSVCVAGRDPLANAEFLAAAFEEWPPSRPVMADLDGQRPDALEHLVQRFALVQVTSDLSGGDAAAERAVQTLRVAAGAGVAHALVLLLSTQTSDGQILRVVEQTHAASGGTMIVVHPPLTAGEAPSADRRWATLLEQASAVHEDVRIALRLPPGLGMR
jgi:hypothetical protein